MICHGAEGAAPRLFAGGLSAARGHHPCKGSVCCARSFGSQACHVQGQNMQKRQGREVWCIWRGEPAGKSDLRGRVISEDVFSPALELRLFCGAGSREGVAPYPEEAETHGTVWAPSWLALSGEVQTSESLFCAF